MTDILYVTDLDGTLLQPDVTISPRSREILCALLRKGLPLTAATARTSFSVMQIFDGIPMQLPLILQNGAVLHDPRRDQIVHAATIRPEVFLQVIRCYAGFGCNGFVFCVPEHTLQCCYTELTTPHMKRYYQERRIKYGKPFMQVRTLEALAEYRPVFLSLNAPKEQLDPVYQAVKTISGIAVAYYKDVYVPEIWFLEVSAPEATKKQGILRLKEMLGAQKIVGFGDNLNDLSLFEACDCKIAVGNASEKLKALADEIIGTNTEDAVAHYLQTRFEGEN